MAGTNQEMFAGCYSKGCAGKSHFKIISRLWQEFSTLSQPLFDYTLQPMDSGSSRQDLGHEPQQLALKRKNFITILAYPTVSKECHFIPSFILIMVSRMKIILFKCRNFCSEFLLLPSRAPLKWTFESCKKIGLGNKMVKYKRKKSKMPSQGWKRSPWKTLHVNLVQRKQ